MMPTTKICIQHSDFFRRLANTQLDKSRECIQHGDAHAAAWHLANGWHFMKWGYWNLAYSPAGKRDPEWSQELRHLAQDCDYRRGLLMQRFYQEAA